MHKRQTIKEILEKYKFSKILPDKIYKAFLMLDEYKPEIYTEGMKIIKNYIHDNLEDTESGKEEVINLMLIFRKILVNGCNIYARLCGEEIYSELLQIRRGNDHRLMGFIAVDMLIDAIFYDYKTGKFFYEKAKNLIKNISKYHRNEFLGNEEIAKQKIEEMIYKLEDENIIERRKAFSEKMAKNINKFHRNELLGSEKITEEEIDQLIHKLDDEDIIERVIAFSKISGMDLEDLLFFEGF